MWDFGDSKESVAGDKFHEDKNALFSMIEEKKKEIVSIIDDYTDADINSDLKEIISNGFQIYVNGKVVNMEVTDVQELPSDKLKNDVKEQFQKKLVEIKEAINEKLYSLSESYESLREKLDDEIEKAKVDSQKITMPDVTYEHAKDGLSVVKGDGSDSLVWLYRGYYIVRTVDGLPIEKSVAEQTMQNVVVKIDTRGNKVTNIKVKKLAKLRDFNHYHATDDGHSDCWGDWEYHQTWQSPEDISRIAKHALEILQDVNTDSPGNSNPRGMPSLDALMASRRRRNNSHREVDESEDEPVSLFDELTQSRNDRNYVWTT